MKDVVNYNVDYQNWVMVVSVLIMSIKLSTEMNSFFSWYRHHHHHHHLVLLIMKALILIKNDVSNAITISEF